MVGIICETKTFLDCDELMFFMIASCYLAIDFFNLKLICLQCLCDWTSGLQIALHKVTLHKEFINQLVTGKMVRKKKKEKRKAYFTMCH